LSTAELTHLNFANTADYASILDIYRLSTAQIAALETTSGISPIVLDMNGDGIQTLSVDQGVLFDLLGNGQTLQTGWASASDGLLARDINRDGKINSGRELFGQGTLLAGGSAAKDGYQALAELDSNKDGVINWQDVDFSSLMVWQDKNADGVTDAGELRSLSQAGVAQLNLAHQAGTATNNGNWLGLEGSYLAADGSTQAMADVWFQVKELDPEELKRRMALLGVPPAPSFDPSGGGGDD